MSTVMYCYWVEKATEFEVAEKVRKFLEENWTIFKAKDSKIHDAIRLAYDFKEEYTANMQLFDVSEDYYLTRFLIDSYIIENNTEKLGLEECFYDDRSDMPKEWEAVDKCLTV